jgi:hypothetical protein
MRSEEKKAKLQRQSRASTPAHRPREQHVVIAKSPRRNNDDDTVTTEAYNRHVDKLLVTNSGEPCRRQRYRAI